MFIYIFGTVKEVHKSSIYLETANGLAFEIFVCSPKSYEVEEQKRLYIYTHSKDEQLGLYGFDDEKHLKIFKLLNEVNGIGPKKAIQIIKNVELDRLIYYISEYRIDELSKINGVGNKAERIVADLRNKIKVFNTEGMRYENVYNALITIGYNSKQLFNVVSNLPLGLTDEEAIKKAIVELKNGTN